MYLHNFKQWVEGRERMKGKLRLNFTAADWVVCWMYLPEITGVIGKWKPKYLTNNIWCHLMHKMKLERQFPGFLSRWCMYSSCLDNIWTIKHLIWEHRTALHWHQPVQTPLYCREHLHMSAWTGGRISAWEQPPEGRGLCVQCLPRSHSCSTKPDPWVETPWPCPKSLSRSSPRQSK